MAASPCKIASVAIAPSLWALAESEGAGPRDMDAVKEEVTQAGRALKKKTFAISLLNGQRMAGAFDAALSVRSDGKALQITLTPHRKTQRTVYTGIYIPGLRKHYGAIMKGEDVIIGKNVPGVDALVRVLQGDRYMITSGPLRELIAIAALAVPSLRAPAP